MRDTDIDRIISHADASIRHWEARKPVQTCDGYSGIVRICDDEQFREAGIVRARVPEPAIPKPSTKDGKDTSVSAGTSTSSSKPQEANQSLTDTADDTTCHEPVNQSLPQDSLPQKTQYDPVAAALAAAQAAVSAAEAAASAAQAAHWAQLSARHKDKAAPAAPQAAPPWSLPPSTSASQPPSSQPPSSHPPPPSPGAITGQGVQHQPQTQPPHQVPQPQHQQPPPPQPPPLVHAQPPPQPPPWSLHMLPDMECTWDDEPAAAAGTDWVSQYVLAGGGQEAAAVKNVPTTCLSEAAEAPEVAPQQKTPASPAALSSLDIDDRELKLDLELLGDLERTLGIVSGGEGGKDGADVTFMEAATRGDSLPLIDLEGSGDVVGRCRGSASGVSGGASSDGGGGAGGDASSSDEVNSEEVEDIKFYALGIDSSSEGGDGGGGDLASEGSGEDESNDKEEEEEEDAEEEDDTDGGEGDGNDGGSSSNGGGGVPLPDVPTKQHSKPASMSTATSRIEDAAVVRPVDASEQQPAPPHGGGTPPGQQQPPTRTSGSPPLEPPPAQPSPAAPPPSQPHTAAATAMPAATAAVAAGAAVDTTTEATTAATAAPAQAAASEGRTEGVKPKTSPPNPHHPQGPSAPSHPAPEAGPPPPQHPPLTKAQLLAKVKRQIASAAVRQARVEEHEQLLWVGDLPQAPSSQVPPRAPRNE